MSEFKRSGAQARVFEGLSRGNAVLQKYETAGLLFGSSLSIIYGKSIRSVKDVDILILSQNCSHHPGQYEGNVRGNDLRMDWWVTHSIDKRPANDNSWAKMCDPANQIILTGGRLLFDPNNDVALYWSVIKKDGVKLLPGLYIPSVDLAKKIKIKELEYPLENVRLRRMQKVLAEQWRQNNYSLTYPVLTEEKLMIQFYDKDSPKDVYCKI